MLRDEINNTAIKVSKAREENVALAAQLDRKRSTGNRSAFSSFRAP